eukprot:TRINITY_DN8786_c0_g1_i1.p1 TRINITY_DN8786_c0_g1~~TRINITY_DN8786_c0_g1_i1.p1  ORF type:complete len:295 (-),score=-17.14 TRINITY_DN8786_c0_g1_i1:467-1351(-)
MVKRDKQTKQSYICNFIQETFKFFFDLLNVCIHYSLFCLQIFLNENFLSPVNIEIRVFYIQYNYSQFMIINTEAKHLFFGWLLDIIKILCIKIILRIRDLVGLVVKKIECLLVVNTLFQRNYMHSRYLKKLHTTREIFFVDICSQLVIRLNKIAIFIALDQLQQTSFSWLCQLKYIISRVPNSQTESILNIHSYLMNVHFTFGDETAKRLHFCSQFGKILPKNISLQTMFFNYVRFCFREQRYREGVYCICMLFFQEIILLFACAKQDFQQNQEFVKKCQDSSCEIRVIFGLLL